MSLDVSKDDIFSEISLLFLDTFKSNQLSIDVIIMLSTENHKSKYSVISKTLDYLISTLWKEVGKYSDIHKPISKKQTTILTEKMQKSIIADHIIIFLNIMHLVGI